ncbi:MAG: alpha-L-rhamnosidase [Fimbriimonas sp.]
MRVTIEADPFPFDPAELPWSGRGQWPCHWIRLPHETEPPFVNAFRIHFDSPEDATVRVHVTADERYELYLDGEYIGRGSERGDANHWFFETYDLPISKGEHTLVARVWALGEKAAYAQHTAEPGFLLCPQDPKWQECIGTGKAPWSARLLSGYAFEDPSTAWGTGHNLRLQGGEAARDWRNGGGDGWAYVEKRATGMSPGVNDRNPVHLLMPAPLPAMLEEPWTRATVEHVSNPPEGPTNLVPIHKANDLAAEHAEWEALLRGEGRVTVPANTRKRVLIDLENYVCGYPRAVLSGGSNAEVRIHWQESLYTTVDGTEKGNRDEVEGKYFKTVWKNGEGVGDTFVACGQPEESFETLWWQAGRYVEVLVTTGSEPLTLDRFQIVETHYPYDFTATFEASDPRLAEVDPVMRRVLEMCSHETYMDCPHYEQLQYVGDTRLQVLATYTLTNDDRLPRKALRMFDASRQLSGLTQSRYPSHVLQLIPPFSLWYVGMLHDFARYRGDMEFVRSLMPGARGVLDAYRAQIKADGLLGAMDGWNFIDWVPSWNGGMAKDASGGVSGILNLHFAYTLRKAAQLEIWLNEPELAGRNLRATDHILRCVNERFWNEERGLYANDLAHTEFSEHAQCLALLTDGVPTSRKERVVEGLLNAEGLDRTTIYFSHYLFETFAALGRTDRILDRMPLWFDHVKNGLHTTIEMPEPTRSDCHAWGAHPLYHYFASFLGIRPTAPGFAEVEIHPQLGPLEWAHGTMPTPLGDLTVEAREDGVRIVVPEGMNALLVHHDKRTPLNAGENNL